MLTSINPATLETIAQYPEDTSIQIQEKLDHAALGQQNWQKLSLSEKCQYLYQLADHLEQNATKYGTIATVEMGKPLNQSIAEVEKCAKSLRYYADHAAQLLAPELVTTEHEESFVSFEPLGTVLTIMPWNFPYWQVYRAMGPILIAGNSMILKHASNVTGCALAIQEAMDTVGFPQYTFQTIVAPSSALEAVYAHPQIQAVAFTGSTAAGKKVAAAAGSYIKKQVLELGGSDAYIICEDANIEKAVNSLTQSRLNNTGQSCIGAKRFIVLDSIKESFISKLKAQFEAAQFADPMTSPALGAMASIAFRNELHEQVQDSIQAGAALICGGYIPQANGAFYPATILSDVKKGMRAYHEEMFGPVATVIIAESLAEAITIFNDTPFGLGGGIFTADTALAKELAMKQLHSGSIAVNHCVSSDPRLPFGGIKESGYGRELSQYGLREFVNIKTITIN